MNRLLSLATLLAVASCGPAAAPVITPTLPGDGSTHTAPPTELSSTVKVDDPWAGRTDLIKAPPAPAPTKLELPPIDRFTLPNGLQVMVVSSDKLPVVSMQLAIRAGRDHEPLARLGVSELAANLLVKGTTKRNALTIAKQIDFVGGTLAADATFEATLLSCSVLAKDAPMCLSLLPEIVTKPAFEESELARMKEQMIGGLRARYDDAGAIAADHLQNVLWGDNHVRGWVLDEEDVAALNRDAVIAWQKAWYAPNNALLTVAGDVNVKTLKAQLTKAFAGWKSHPLAPVQTYPDPSTSGVKIQLVDMPGQPQAQIRVGQLGISHDDPKFFDTLVWNYVLGGGQFSSRLMKVVRSEGGKTYGASSAFDRNLARGAVVAATFTRTAETVATTKLVIAEIAKMAESGPTATEVEGAVANLAGAQTMRFQSAGDVAAALLLAELHNFGVEYLQNYGVRLGMVTAASAAEAAKQVLDPRNYSLVIVGDAAGIEPQLKAAGWRYVKVPYAAPIGARIAKPAVSTAPTGLTDKAAIAAATAAIEQAITAKGGRAALAGIKTIRLTAAGTISGGSQVVPMSMTRTVQLPDKNRLDLLLGGNTPFAIGVDGNVGWQKSPEGIVDIPATEIGLLDVERWREPELILLRAGEAGTKVALLPGEKIDGRAQTKVLLSGKDGRWAVLWLDNASHMISRVNYNDETGSATVDDFSDYSAEGAIQVAHKRTTTSAIGRVSTLTVSRAEFNVTVDPAIFKKPSS